MGNFKSVTNGAVKDVDMKGRTVTGYYASWGDVGDGQLFIDSDGDAFDQHAFDKTIAMNGKSGANRIWHLFNHNFGSPVNKPNVLKADSFGVYFETTFLDTVLGNDLLKLYEAGAITEHSVMFNTIQARNEIGGDGKEYQLIQEVRMWEGSSVLWGANERTPTTGMKGEQVEANIKLLDTLLHNGTFSDEAFKMLEKVFNDIKNIYVTGSTETQTPAQQQAILTPEQIKIQFLKNFNSKI